MVESTPKLNHTERMTLVAQIEELESKLKVSQLLVNCLRTNLMQELDKKASLEAEIAVLKRVQTNAYAGNLNALYETDSEIILHLTQSEPSNLSDCSFKL